MDILTPASGRLDSHLNGGPLDVAVSLGELVVDDETSLVRVPVFTPDGIPVVAVLSVQPSKRPTDITPEDSVPEGSERAASANQNDHEVSTMQEEHVALADERKPVNKPAATNGVLVKTAPLTEPGWAERMKPAALVGPIVSAYHTSRRRLAPEPGKAPKWWQSPRAIIGGYIVLGLLAALLVGKIVSAIVAGPGQSVLIYHDNLVTSSTTYKSTPNCSVRSDGLHVIAPNPVNGFLCAFPTQRLGRTDVTVTARQIAGSPLAGYGLVVRKNGESYYQFVVNSNGAWTAVKCTNGSCPTLHDFVTSSVIHTGVGAANVLRMQAVGAKIALFINGIQVATLTDRSFAEGYVAAYTTAATEASFTNVTISQPVG